MVIKLQLQKLARYAQQDGLKIATRIAGNHIKNTCLQSIEGSPGYYDFRRKILTRKYSIDTITPRWVSPDEITALTGEYSLRDTGHLDYVPYFKPRETHSFLSPYQVEEPIPYGTEREGNWDQNRPSFSNLILYQGASQRFIDGYSWEDTVYYQKLFERFRSDGWTSQDAKKLVLERCEHIDRVFENIKSNGYRSQMELNGYPLNEVAVNIARDGELLYNSEGRHRLSIAKILNIDKVPIIPLVYHKEYK